MSNYNYRPQDVAEARAVLAATRTVLETGGWQTGFYGDPYSDLGGHDLYGAFARATMTTDAYGTPRSLPWQQNGRPTGLALQVLQDAATVAYQRARDGGRVDGPKTLVSLAAVSDLVIGPDGLADALALLDDADALLIALEAGETVALGCGPVAVR